MESFQLTAQISYEGTALATKLLLGGGSVLSLLSLLGIAGLGGWWLYGKVSAKSEKNSHSRETDIEQLKAAVYDLANGVNIVVSRQTAKETESVAGRRMEVIAEAEAAGKWKPPFPNEKETT